MNAHITDIEEQTREREWEGEKIYNYGTAESAYKTTMINLN